MEKKKMKQSTDKNRNLMREKKIYFIFNFVFFLLFIMKVPLICHNIYLIGLQKMVSRMIYVFRCKIVFGSVWCLFSCAIFSIFIKLKRKTIKSINYNWLFLGIPNKCAFAYQQKVISVKEYGTFVGIFFFFVEQDRQKFIIIIIFLVLIGENVFLYT